MSQTGVSLVLLCSEEDDLDLVDLVHRARHHGMIPQVIAGIEGDDAPLLAAIADEDNAKALFVLLRSDFLSAERMRELKTTFGRARTRHQELLAVRLDPGRTDAVLATLLARTQATRAPSRRRSRPEMSAVTALVERSGVLRLIPTGEVTPPDAIAALPLDPSAFATEESDLELGIEIDDAPSELPSARGVPEAMSSPPGTGELETWIDAPSDVTVPSGVLPEPSIPIAAAPRRSRWGLAVGGALAVATALGGAGWVSQRGASEPEATQPVERDPRRSRVEGPAPTASAERPDEVDRGIEDEPVAQGEEAVVIDDEPARARPRKRSTKHAKKADDVESPEVAPVEAVPAPATPATVPAAEPAPAAPAPAGSAPTEPAAPLDGAAPVAVGADARP